MAREHTIDPQKFYEIATAPTYNDQLDAGSWLAPVLDSDDPALDRRAAQPIHFYADDTDLSVCGIRYLAPHYIDAPESPAEVRRRCARCMHLIAMTRVTPIEQAQRIVPQRNVFSHSDFQALLTVTVPWAFAFRINRVAVIDGDLYLMADLGELPGGSLKRYIRALEKNKSFDEVIIVPTVDLEESFENTRSFAAAAADDEHAEPGDTASDDLITAAPEPADVAVAA